jgi:hypothetical protein
MALKNTIDLIQERIEASPECSQDNGWFAYPCARKIKIKKAARTSDLDSALGISVVPPKNPNRFGDEIEICARLFPEVEGSAR